MSLQREAGLSTERGTVVRIGGFVQERSIADWSIDPRAIVDLETIQLPGNARSDVEIVGLEARLPFESIRADFAIEFTVTDWPRAISWGIGSDQLLFAPRDGWVWFGPAPLEPARRGQPRRYAELLDYNAVAGRPDRTAADPALHGVEALRVTVTDGVLTLRAVARDREVTIFEQRITRFAIPRAPRFEVQGGDLKLRRVVFEGMPSATEVRRRAFENREWTRVGSAIDAGDIDAALFPHAEVESHGNGAVTLTYDFSDGAPPSWRVKPRAGTRPTPMGVTTIVPGGVRFEFRPTFAALAEGTLVLRRFGTNPFEVLAQFPGRGVHSALRTRYLESAPGERATGGYLDDTSGSAPPIAAGQRLELTHERVEGDASRVRWLRNKRVLATLSVAPTPRPSAVEWELRGARARVEEVRLHGVVQDGWRFDRTRAIRVRGAWERAMRTGEEFTPSWESFLRHGGEAKEVDGGWRLLPPESLRPHGNATALAFELWPDVWDRWRRASISTDIRLGAEKLWHAGFAVGFEGIGRPYLFVGANGNREVHAAVVEGRPPERVIAKERARLRSGQTWRLEIVARKGVLSVGRRTRLEFDIPPEIPIDAPIAVIARAGGAPIQVTPPVIAPVLAE